MTYYRGDGIARPGTELPVPPPWRTFPRTSQATVFQPPEGLTDAVDAALALRRPLLITGGPGTGKSTVVEQVAAELDLGPVLRWHITSRSTLADALYRYDALGRIHAHRLQQAGARAGEEAGNDSIDDFLTLGQLGTALLPAPRPRALLIDEIDKADLDLPGDLLDVLERGEFHITELLREGQEEAHVRLWGDGQRHLVRDGHIQCTEFPFIVMTSNGEQDMPAPLLRRCVRFTMPKPDTAFVTRVVRAHLGPDTGADDPAAALVNDYVQRVAAGGSVAIDQLLSTLHLLNGTARTPEERQRVVALLMKDLSGA